MGLSDFSASVRKQKNKDKMKVFIVLAAVIGIALAAPADYSNLVKALEKILHENKNVYTVAEYNGNICVTLQKTTAMPGNVLMKLVYYPASSPDDVTVAMEATQWGQIGSCTLASPFSSGTYVLPNCVEIPVSSFASGTNDYVFMTKVGANGEDGSSSTFSVTNNAKAMTKENLLKALLNLLDD